ncbi:MAG: WD40 repeat domain-containing serine/threonine protein kinase [Isosphaeraceae bacterium]|nr:WD40 repeat domain-containing serine/threonine protein kinase [Isosphaeraceae bacterium]
MSRSKGSRECPTLEEWELLLEDALPDERIQEMERHLAGCPDCGRVVRELAPDLPRPSDPDPSDSNERREWRIPNSEGVAPEQRPSPPRRERDADDLDEAGQYRLLEVIGKGRMGVVYRAEQKVVGRKVAVKVLSNHAFAIPGSDERFTNEIRGLGRLDHPNIVHVLDAGRVGDEAYFSMTLVDGPNLEELLRSRRFSVDESLELIETIALAVDHAHNQGVIHRDLKPANILMSRSKHPMVADFGLATTVDRALGEVDRDEVAGTPAYMAPEQWLPHRGVDRKADIFALGCIFYELLAGRPAFGDPADSGAARESSDDARESHRAEIERRILRGKPTSLRSLDPRIPADLEAICLKCLQKARDLRYSTAQELVDDLRRFRRGEETSARRLGRGERIAYFLARHPWSAAAAALALVSAISFASIVGTQYRNARIQYAQTLFEAGNSEIDRGALDVGLRKLADAHSILASWRSDDAPLIGEAIDRWRRRIPARSTLVRHDSPIAHARMSSDGRLVFADSRGGVYSNHRGRLAQLIPPGNAEFTWTKDLSLSRGGSRLLVITNSGNPPELIDTDRNRRVGSLDLGGQTAVCGALLNDRGGSVVSLGPPERLRFTFPPDDLSPSQFVDLPIPEIASRIVASRDGVLILVFGDTKVLLVDTETRTLIKQFDRKDTTCGDFSEDGKTIALCGSQLRVIDAGTGNQLAIHGFSAGRRPIEVRGTPNNGFLIAVETEKGPRFTRFRVGFGFEDEVPAGIAHHSVRLESDWTLGEFLVGITTNVLEVGRLPEIAATSFDLGQGYSFARIAVTSDGRRIISAAQPSLTPEARNQLRDPATRLRFYRSDFHVWERDPPAQSIHLGERLGPGHVVGGIAFAPNDRSVALGTGAPIRAEFGKSYLSFFETPGLLPEKLERAAEVSEAIHELMFTRSGKELVYSTLHQFDDQGANLAVRTLEGGVEKRVKIPSKPSCMAVARKADLIAVGTMDGVVHLLSTTDLQVLGSTDQFEGAITAIDLSDDGGTIAFGTSLGRAHIVERRVGGLAPPRLFASAEDRIRGIAIDTAQGRVRICVNKGGAALSEWDLRTGRPIGPPLSFIANVMTCRFAANHRTAVILTADAKLWVSENE